MANSGAEIKCGGDRAYYNRAKTTSAFHRRSNSPTPRHFLALLSMSLGTGQVTLERSTAKPMDCVVSGNAWPEL